MREKVTCPVCRGWRCYNIINPSTPNEHPRVTRCSRCKGKGVVTKITKYKKR